MGLKIRKRRLSLDDIEKELRGYEAKYKMSSPDFYEKFNRGELGDGQDYFKWASLYDMAARARARKPITA